MSRREPELLGFHGLVLRSTDPARLARRWTELTGMPVLRRRRGEIVLGNGPELFLAIRRKREGGPDELREVHLAVKELSALRGRRKGERDPLGGDSWARRAGTLDVVVREFARPPSAAWRKKRAPR